MVLIFPKKNLKDIKSFRNLFSSLMKLDHLQEDSLPNEDPPDENYLSFSSDSESDVDESLSSTILQEIENGTYTCLVCTSEIDAYSQIWSCSACYRVYDLECIRDWATRGLSTDSSKHWRCPSCNTETKEVPKTFKCWCGKVKNPDPNPMMPFSCGSICGAKYDECVHSCSSVCHPALHPVCGALGPIMKCLCGGSQRQLPCLITPYKDGWHCNKSCGIKLCPLGHVCTKGCHGGFCGKCTEPVPSKCYCGRNILDLQCYQRDPQRCQLQGQSPENPSPESWIGFGACDESTTLYLDCGIHFESLKCQPPKIAPQCKLSPSVIKSCYCGKTAITPGQRLKCTDPIPECENACGKILPCGCTCRMKCHSGECKCYNIVTKKCDCGNSEFLVPCGFEGSPKCHHKCSVLMNCRKHYHKQECCSYERAALERERQRKKAVRNGLRQSVVDEDEIMTLEPVHICMRTCNRLKSCGKHECDALCHAGLCGVCLESSSEDLVCHCGKTVLPAPVRCGTKIHCDYQCVRETACGHRPEVHNCHEDDANCPKCTQLVSKICDCGNKEMKNILCSQTSVSCGKICSEPKSCGHPCQRVCSKQCVEENNHASSSVCQSLCGKVRVNCPHLCAQKCHINKVGKSKKCDAVSCGVEVTIACACGRRSQKSSCGASLLTSSKIGTELPCDEACATAKRDLDLKHAFMGIDASSLNKIIYSDYVLNTFTRQRKWCVQMEAQIREFVSDAIDEIEALKNSEAENDEATVHKVFSHSFSSAIKPQRQFIHELAAAYKLHSESQGKDPNRYVFVAMTPSSCIPAKTIDDILKVRSEFELERKRIEDMKQFEVADAPCNALIVEDAFFGITKAQLEKTLLSEAEASGFQMRLEWNKGSTFIVFPSNKLSELELLQLMKQFRKIIREDLLAFDVKMCLTDPDGEKVLKTLVKVTQDIPSEEFSSSESSEITTKSTTEKEEDTDDNLKNIIDNETELEISTPSSVDELTSSVVNINIEHDDLTKLK